MGLEVVGQIVSLRHVLREVGASDVLPVPGAPWRKTKRQCERGGIGVCIAKKSVYSVQRRLFMKKK